MQEEQSIAGMSAWMRVRELVQFREVIKNFVAQSLKVKYRRSVLGFFWSLLNPLLQLLVISVVFSLLFNLNNFALYLLAGLVPWMFFAAAIQECSVSLIAAEPMLRRQYFPKLVFPLCAVLQNLVAFALSMVVLLAVLAPLIEFRPTAAWLFLPVSFLLIVGFALGLGALAAVATVYFRDMQHLIAVFLSAWFYLTPIIYPLETRGGPPPLSPRMAGAAGAGTRPAESQSHTSTEGRSHEADGLPIPMKYRGYFKLNPMYPLIEMFHRPIYDGVVPSAGSLAAAVAVSGLTAVAGLWVFWRQEDRIIFAL